MIPSPVGFRHHAQAQLLKAKQSLAPPVTSWDSDRPSASQQVMG